MSAVTLKELNVDVATMDGKLELSAMADASDGKLELSLAMDGKIDLNSAADGKLNSIESLSPEDLEGILLMPTDFIPDQESMSIPPLFSDSAPISSVPSEANQISSLPLISTSSANPTLPLISTSSANPTLPVNSTNSSSNLCKIIQSESGKAIIQVSEKKPSEKKPSSKVNITDSASLKSLEQRAKKVTDVKFHKSIIKILFSLLKDENNSINPTTKRKKLLKIIRKLNEAEKKKNTIKSKKDANELKKNGVELESKIETKSAAQREVKKSIVNDHKSTPAISKPITTNPKSAATSPKSAATNAKLIPVVAEPFENFTAPLDYPNSMVSRDEKNVKNFKDNNNFKGDNNFKVNNNSKGNKNDDNSDDESEDDLDLMDIAMGVKSKLTSTREGRVIYVNGVKQETKGIAANRWCVKRKRNEKDKIVKRAKVLKSKPSEGNGDGDNEIIISDDLKDIDPNMFIFDHDDPLI